MKYKRKSGNFIFSAIIIIIFLLLNRPEEAFCFHELKSSQGNNYNILRFGAKGDGKFLNTKAIQTAIDACSKTGGRVIFPQGTFLTGTVYLKSNVNLFLEKGAVLLGSPSLKDYPLNNVHYQNIFTHSNKGTVQMSRALIFAEGAENISIGGRGTINGNGGSPEFDLGNDGASAESRQRPCGLLIINCTQIKVEGIFLTNSAYWMQNYLGCSNLHLKKLKVYNHSNYNQDGMDIDARNVLIEDCEIDVDDDGICFKNHERKNICENIIVRNCKIASNCNAIKFGTVGIGGLKNVKISDCVITAASADHIRHWQKQLKFIELPVTVLAGIALETVDGASIDSVEISGIRMTGVQTPIFIVLGNRGRNAVGSSGKSPAGSIKNVTIENITAISHSKMPSSITALPGYYAENIKLNNITISSMGKGTYEEGKMPLRENPSAYPENRMYGEVYPASGFYIRHAKGIEINNLKLSLRNPDSRPAIILDDVFNSSISNLKADAPSGEAAAVHIIKSAGIKIKGAKLDRQQAKLVGLTETQDTDVTIE